jgi:formate hydrogenlyase subunit 3/multisubunit Na+/H+ antiporter MnhD subunit
VACLALRAPKRTSCLLTSALKFFIYTLAGSLALLLGIIGIYLATDPRTFDMAEIPELPRQELRGLSSSGTSCRFTSAHTAEAPWFRTQWCVPAGAFLRG